MPRRDDDAEMDSRDFPRVTECREQRWRRIHTWLTQPVHCSTLGVFRLLYGICMYEQACKFSHMYEEFGSSKAVFPYPGLDLWLPVSPTWGERVLLINRIAAVCVAIGAGTRVATPILFLSFTYLFLNCVSFHNNHYILICHLSGVASFTHWGRWFSVDEVLAARWRRPQLGARGERGDGATVPYWNLLMLQFLFSVPYFFGAVAKLNDDWILRAEPVKNWLHPGSRKLRHFPTFISHAWWFPWMIAWGGCAFDAFIVPILFSRPLRLLLGFPGALCFNMMNKCMFNIGIFPYAMLASLTLFLEPDFFGHLLRRALGGAPTVLDPLEPFESYRPLRWHPWWFILQLPQPPPRSSSPSHDAELGTERPADAGTMAETMSHRELQLRKEHSSDGLHPPTRKLSWQEAALLASLSSYVAFHREHRSCVHRRLRLVSALAQR